MWKDGQSLMPDKGIIIILPESQRLVPYCENRLNAVFIMQTNAQSRHFLYSQRNHQNLKDRASKAKSHPSSIQLNHFQTLRLIPPHTLGNPVQIPTVHTDLVMEKLTRTSNRLTLFIVSTYDAHKSPYVSEPCSLRNRTRYLRNHVSYNYFMQQINGKWSAFYCICNSGMISTQIKKASVLF